MHDIPEINIRTELPRIRDMGFVKSLRLSDTGIGFTFETLMGIKENNLRNHDFTYSRFLLPVKLSSSNSISLRSFIGAGLLDFRENACPYLYANLS